ncbi:MAG: hypothetical protein LRY27_02455 [Chitinophagales bacterium]|nr:hypothetical protein [Chitinophagales bacterium]
MKKGFNYIYLLLIMACLLYSCAKYNAGIAKQTYHDITGHYNGYFNAKENYDVQLRNLIKNNSEDYDQILPLYVYGNLDDIKDQNAVLQTSIEKHAFYTNPPRKKENKIIKMGR